MTPPHKEKCTHCGGDLSKRNPMGHCDHLQYPEYCEICKNTPPSQTEEQKAVQEAADRSTAEQVKVLKEAGYFKPRPPQDEEWEKKFNRRFCLDDDWDNQLYGYRPVGLVVVNNEVKDFIRNLLSEREKEYVSNLKEEEEKYRQFYEKMTGKELSKDYRYAVDNFIDYLVEKAHLRTKRGGEK